MKNIFPLLLIVLISYKVTDVYKFETEKTSGAFDAITYYSQMRDFPNNDIPRDAYTRAYEQKKRVPIIERDNFDPWVNLGPTNVGGRTLSIAIDHIDTNVVWIGAASGGLWKSTTGGFGSNAWTNIQTGFPVLSVSSIVIDSNDRNVMYIGTGESYGYQDSHNGLSIRTTRGSYGIGILKSTNGGLNWTKSLDWSMNQNRGVWDIIYNPLNHNILYAGTTEGIFKSTNAGENWTQIFNELMVMDLEMDRIDTNIIFAGVGNLSSANPGIYRSSNGGENWTRINSGLPVNNTGRTTISSYYGNPSILFAVIGERLSTVGVYRSTNKGIDWEQTSGANPNILESQGWYASGVKIKDDDSSKLLFSGVDFYKSTNFGDTVLLSTSSNTNDSNYMHVDHHRIISNPKDANKIYIATDGGLYRTNDFGGKYYRAVTGYVTTQFYKTVANSPLDSVLIVGGLQDNGIVRWDGTGNWHRAASGDGMMCIINPLNKNTVLCCNQYLEINRSYNKGQSGSWTMVRSPNISTQAAFIAPLVISPSDTSVYYGGTKLIVKSTDGGTTWSNVSANLDGNNILSIAVSYMSSDTLYAATVPTGNNMGLFRSVNGGVNWVNVSTGLPANRYPTDIELNPKDSREIYVTFGGFGTGHIFKSTDGGDNWTDITGVLPDIPFHCAVIDSAYPDNIYVGSDIGSYASTNGGTDWYDLNNGFPEAVMVFDLSISYSNRKLRAGTHGRGVYQRTLVSDQPLPVELVNFNSEIKNNDVVLRWNTSLEINNKGFEVERKRSEKNDWDKIGFVKGNGNSNEIKNYLYTDKNLQTGVYRYRLKQIDYNGNFRYYELQNEINIGVPFEFMLSQNYPNPFNPNTAIDFQLPERSDVQLVIYDVSGREISKLKNEIMDAGYYRINFSGVNLSSGIYFYTLRAGKYSQTKKMMMLK